MLFARYAARRIAHAVLVVWITFTAAFALLFVLPGNAALSKIAGGGDSSGALTAANVDKLRKAMGLDRPVYVQYVSALWNALHGNFGLSFETGGSATSLFYGAVTPTLELAASALLFGSVFGISWAVAASLVPWQGAREFFAGMPALGVAIPTFWIGLVLIQIFSFRLGWLPSVGDSGVASLVLPAVTLGIPTAAIVAQLLLRSLSEVQASPYIETARAKGLSHWSVTTRHALRNAIIPVITALGLNAGYLLAGSAIAETVFSRAGIGAITVNAVNTKDTPVVLAAVVFVAAVFASVNLIVDLLYPLIDKRIELAPATVKAG